MVQTLKTKGNTALKEKLKKQAGFTLVELLVVVAIVAILAAVAVPAFTSVLENSRETADRSNAQAASSMATSDYLLQQYTGKVEYTFGLDANGSLGISSVTGASGFTSKTTTITAVTGDHGLKGQSKKVGDKALTVTVEDGAITAQTWIAALNNTTP